MAEAEKPTSGGAAAACWCYWNAEYQRGHITKLEYLKRTAWARDETAQKFQEGLANGMWLLLCYAASSLETEMWNASEVALFQLIFLDMIVGVDSFIYRISS